MKNNHIILISYIFILFILGNNLILSGGDDNVTKEKEVNNNSAGYRRLRYFGKIDNFTFHPEYIENHDFYSTILNKLEMKAERDNNFEQFIYENYNLILPELAEILGNETLFKEVFLRPYFKSGIITQEIEDDLQKISQKSKEGKKISKQEFENRIKKLNEKKIQASNSKIGIIFTSCDFHKKWYLREAAKLWGEKEGLLHLGLFLNGLILEWGRGYCGPNLVCPTNDIHEFLLSYELNPPKNHWTKIKNLFKVYNTSIYDYYFKTEDRKKNKNEITPFIEDILDIIAKKCVEYNKKYYYDFKHKNCHNFIDELINELQINYNIIGEFKKVISSFIKNENYLYTFHNMTFEKRSQLDDYVNKINFSSLETEDKQLLISYKNSFEILSELYPDNEMYWTTDESEEFWNELLVKEKFSDNYN